MSIKILLAEDSRTIQKAVQIGFRKTDAEIATANNNTELFSVLGSWSPSIVLLSATLPGINLEQDIPKISQKGNGYIPVLLMAERGRGFDETKSLSLGAAGFLFKPLDDRKLKQSIKVIMESEPPAVEKMETQTQPAVQSNGTESMVTRETPRVSPQPSGEILKAPALGSPEQRAQVLVEVLESYLNENVVLITDALAKNLAPKIAPEVAGKIIESIDFTNLPFKIATIVEGVIQDLVPQLAEELISRELDKIKEEAARLLDVESQEQE